MARDELAEKLLFDLGRVVLGKNSGGMIKKLMDARGISSAGSILKTAAEKSDPREWVGAAIRNAADDQQAPKARVGEVMGNGKWARRWNGSRWAEIEA